MKNIINLLGMMAALMLSVQIFSGCTTAAHMDPSTIRKLDSLIAQSDEDAIDYIKKHDINVNAVDTNGSGDSLLHIAAVYANKTVAEYLIKQGANVNARSKGGETPIYMAAMINDVQVVKLLLNAGADLTIADVNGLTPLEIARVRGNQSVVKFLTAAD